MSLAAVAETTSGLVPLALQNAPSFIERQFPVGRLSAEAYKERKAGSGQTLTALGSYWKGRKPLILVRAVVLGCLLPATKDASADLAIFLKLMAMDDAAFGRRFDGSAAEFARLFPDAAEQVATNRERAWRNDVPADELRRRLAPFMRRDGGSRPAAVSRLLLKALGKFVANRRASKPGVAAEEFASAFPEAADDLTEEVEVRWRWRTDISLGERQAAIGRAFAILPYAERLKHVRRPEECNEADLLAPIWRGVNRYLGTSARSLPDLVEQLGIARFGHRPKVADTFCGAGSIPFEAARIGCDVYASDLNPVACMLTWGAFNVIGAPEEQRANIDEAQRQVAEAVDAEITRLGIEHDLQGNRAKAYLYCQETRCPKTGWLVPMLGTLLISKAWRTIAVLEPDHTNLRYDIKIKADVSTAELAEAEVGTVRDGRLVHPMNPERSGVEVKTIRGDHRDAEGKSRNRLRLWTKDEFLPQPGDILQERLYCIQWITKSSLGKGRQETFFAAVTEDDLERERRVEAIIRENLARWQDEGLVPNMPIEPGDETSRLGRERGWTYWHHLFGARPILVISTIHRFNRTPIGSLEIARSADRLSKLCRFNANPQPSQGPKIEQVFSNQALNPLINYGIYSFAGIEDYTSKLSNTPIQVREHLVETTPAVNSRANPHVYITDPPYADAINYHEITEFFIAWLRKNPPPPFDLWTWDSRRDLAIKGKDEQFRRDLVAAYAAMTHRMPDNGLQVVMFTHQNAGVWADLGAVLWAAGLRVTAAWNVVTETESGLKEGNYVQGTVCLVLRKRTSEANARRMEIEAEIEEAVAVQLARLNALDDAWHERTSAETLYTDGDLTLAAYAAALQVVTAYSTIDRQPLDRDLYRKLGKGETTMLRELVDYAAQVANSLLVPEGFPREMWRDLGAAERFYVRMLDMEAKGSAKVADFQNFAKSFAFGGYAELMASTTANAAALAGAADLKGRMLEGGGFASTQLRQVLFAIWKSMEGGQRDPKRGVTILRTEFAADYWQRRQKLIALAAYVAMKTARTRPEESAAAHELAEALKLDRV
jgi:putative DNA methylase